MASAKLKSPEILGWVSHARFPTKQASFPNSNKAVFSYFATSPPLRRQWPNSLHTALDYPVIHPRYASEKRWDAFNLLCLNKSKDAPLPVEEHSTQNLDQSPLCTNFQKDYGIIHSSVRWSCNCIFRDWCIAEQVWLKSRTEPACPLRQAELFKAKCDSKLGPILWRRKQSPVTRCWSENSIIVKSQTC